MDQFIEFAIWLRSMAPWWILIITIPVAKIIWDYYLQPAWFKHDRCRYSLPKAVKRRAARIRIGNYTTVFVTLIFTVLATSEAYRVDQEIRDTVASHSVELSPASQSGIAFRVGRIATDVESLKANKIDEDRFMHFFNCTKQYIEDDDLNENCFPD